MSRRTQIGILIALLIVLALVAYWNLRPTASAGSDGTATIAVQPLRVTNPSLHLSQLDQIRRLTYSGTHRNIFSATPPPPPPAAIAKARAGRDAPQRDAGPPAPPPLVVPLTFYGMAVDPKTGKQLAFFTSGDDIYIASVGDTLIGRFRLVRIGSDTAVLQEISTGRQATLMMTSPVTGEPPSPMPNPGL